jgi:hypothetical protein
MLKDVSACQGAFSRLLEGFFGGLMVFLPVPVACLVRLIAV